MYVYFIFSFKVAVTADICSFFFITENIYKLIANGILNYKCTLKKVIVTQKLYAHHYEEKHFFELVRTKYFNSCHYGIAER
jgi:hypothetical protein